MKSKQFLTLIETSTTWALVALIWVVQLVHYPAFLYIDMAKAAAFHQMHTQQITLVVMPLMLLELSLAVWRCTLKLPFWATYLPLVLVTIIWLSTFLIQVPLHHQLGNSWEEPIVDRLIKTNWIRTILWTVKGVLLLYCARKI